MRNPAQPRSNREALLLIGLFVALILSVALGYLLTPHEDAETTLSAHTTGPSGAQALQLWLSDLGYRTSNIEYRSSFSIPQDARLLFLMVPTVEVTVGDSDAIENWVKAGGTLILVDSASGFPNPALNLLRDRLNVRTTLAGPANAFKPGQPLLVRPPFDTISATVRSTIIMTRSDYVDYLLPTSYTSNNVTLVGFRTGKGYVFYTNLVGVFANDTIDDAGNARLILNMIANIPQGSQVVFDEYHHGFIAERDLRTLLYETPWGWGLLYAAIIIFLYIALNGRRFGAAIPLSRALGRSTAEYVVSMASLFRRAHKRDYIRMHYYRELKRVLARKYTVNPKLENEQFVNELALRTTIDGQRLLNLLNRLERTSLSESQLLAAAREVDTIVKETERRGIKA